MSRNYRGRPFIHRWGQARVGKPKKSDQVAYLNRVVKRMNKALGQDKKPFEWHYPGGMVIAFTRSEARALIKKDLDIPKKKRLPPNFIITKGERFEQDQPSSSE